MSALYYSRAACWLIADTFRQSVASGICWFLLAATLITTLVCLSVQIDDTAMSPTTAESSEFLSRNDPLATDRNNAIAEGVAIAGGSATVGFGAIRVPLARDAESAVQGIELMLAAGLADTLGLLLTLVWTAGFLPHFLDRRNITVLLTKPVPRWYLLGAKYLGVLSFVLAHGILFVGATWLALGIRTGVWHVSYWWCVPLLVLHFAIFFSFSLLLAVCTRSTAVCVFGSLLFWFVCWAMNYGRHAAILARQLAPESAISPRLTWLGEAGYWILPKPADMSYLLFDALRAGEYFQQPIDFAALSQAGALSLGLSVTTSLAFTAYVLLAAARQFECADY
jgi:hypothetical protein